MLRILLVYQSCLKFLPSIMKSIYFESYLIDFDHNQDYAD